MISIIFNTAEEVSNENNILIVSRFVKIRKH